MSEPNLDFDSLLQPISSDEPAGPVLYDVRMQLDEMRKVKVDPTNPDNASKPNFREVIRLAEEALTNKSKDLIIATRLVEALTVERNFNGLRDGLRLLRLLVEQCWDRMNPPIDPEDPETRALPFNWLCDAAHKPYFPALRVRTMPLFGTRDQPFSYFDYEQIQTKDDAERRAQYEDAIANTSVDTIRDLYADSLEALEEIEKMDALLGAKMEGYQPNLEGLRAAIRDCGHLLKENLPADPTEAPAWSDTSDTGGTGAGGGGGGGGGGGFGSLSGGGSVATRTEAYRQLAHIATVLREIEPHSPIPYLLDKAVEWGNLSFPQLIAALIRDANVLGELNRELGIKDSGG